MLIIAALAVALSACASMRRAEWRVIGPDPAPSAGFIDKPDRMLDATRPSVFAKSWSSQRKDWRRMQKLYVAPVDISHALPLDWWDAINIRASKVSWDLPIEADQLHDRVEDAFRDDPQKHFIVIDDPAEIDADTAVLQMSLVELVPNKAILGVIGIAAWGAPLEIGIPVATLTAFISHGSTAMECEVRDAGTGKVLASFADRQTGKMRVIDLRSLSWYANAHETMDDWADGLVDLANAPPGKRPKPAALFTFMPW